MSPICGICDVPLRKNKRRTSRWVPQDFNLRFGGLAKPSGSFKPGSGAGELALTVLERRLVQQIILHIRRENLPVGARLVELTLAKNLGTGRTPIRAALVYLKKRGVVHYRRNRGYFMTLPPSKLSDLANELALTSEDPAYVRILHSRMQRKIPDVVTEADLARKVRYSRTKIRKVLGRITKEGWVERRPGQGWQFLGTIDSAEALKESMDLLLMIEPQAMLSPGFRPNPVVLKGYIDWTKGTAGGAYGSMTAMEIFNKSAELHEMLAIWSNNRFIVQAIRRITQLRRRFHYGCLSAQLKHGLFQDHFQEHLAIAEKVAQNDHRSAASLLRDHLLRARERAVGEPFACAWRF